MFGNTLLYTTAATVLAGFMYATPNEQVRDGYAIRSVNDYDGIGSGTDRYKFYSCDGTIMAS
jgi:hypothetical protein